MRTAVRCRAIERGLMAPETQLERERDFRAASFSRDFRPPRQVTDVSGRGVGMDVVRQRVDSLRGSIDVAEQAGHREPA